MIIEYDNNKLGLKKTICPNGFKPKHNIIPMVTSIPCRSCKYFNVELKGNKIECSYGEEE